MSKLISDEENKKIDNKVSYDTRLQYKRHYL